MTQQRRLFAIELRVAIIMPAILLALVSDLRSYKIKNSITYGFMAAGLAANLMLEGIPGILFSLQGIIAPVICLLLLYTLRMIGAGDIKLFCAVGAAMGAAFTLYALAYAFVCGGVIAAILILNRQNGLQRLRHIAAYTKSCFLLMKPLSYTDFAEKQDGSKFHFSIAAASGTVAALLLNTSIL